MKYLIDTCVISELIKKTPNPNIKTWFDLHQKEQLFLSAISIAEIKKGIYKIKPKEPERALKLQNWLDTIELSFSQRILPIDNNILVDAQ